MSGRGESYGRCKRCGRRPARFGGRDCAACEANVNRVLKNIRPKRPSSRGFWVLVLFVVLIMLVVAVRARGQEPSPSPSPRPQVSPTHYVYPTEPPSPGPAPSPSPSSTPSPEPTTRPAPTPSPSVWEPAPVASPPLPPYEPPAPRPTPRPTPTPRVPRGTPPAEFHVWAGRQHGFTGESTGNEWVAGVEVEGPVAGLAPLAVGVGLQIDALPGEGPVQIQDPTTWGRSADLRLSLRAPLTRRTSTDGSQDLSLEGVASWGFLTALEGRGLQRYARTWGFGLRLAEHRSGAFVEVLWGRFEPCGPMGRGQLLVSGRFPLVRLFGQRATIALLGDAAVNVREPGDELPGGARRDVMRLSVAVSK